MVIIIITSISININIITIIYDEVTAIRSDTSLASM
jgi:hypothetical protein